MRGGAEGGLTQPRAEPAAEGLIFTSSIFSEKFGIKMFPCFLLACKKTPWLPGGPGWSSWHQINTAGSWAGAGTGGPVPAFLSPWPWTETGGRWVEHHIPPWELPTLVQGCEKLGVLRDPFPIPRPTEAMEPGKWRLRNRDCVGPSQRSC